MVAIAGLWFNEGTASARRLLIKSASIVLASFRSSRYPRGHASGLHSLRPCWTAFLNSLRRSQKECWRFRHPCVLCAQVVCQRLARQLRVLAFVGRKRRMRHVGIHPDLRLCRHGDDLSVIHLRRLERLSPRCGRELRVFASGSEVFRRVDVNN